LKFDEKKTAENHYFGIAEKQLAQISYQTRQDLEKLHKAYGQIATKDNPKSPTSIRRLKAYKNERARIIAHYFAQLNKIKREDPPSNSLESLAIIKGSKGQKPDSSTLVYIKLTTTPSEEIYYKVKSVSGLVVSANLQGNYFNNFFLVRTRPSAIPKPNEDKGAPPNCKDCAQELGNKRSFSQIVYQDFVSKINLVHLDSILSTKNGLQGGRVSTSTINGTQSLIFTHRFQFDENDDWILCGVVNAKEFDRQRLSIELFWVVVLFIGSVFILLALPIIKLAVMSAFERLQIVNVWFTGFALVVGTALLVLLLIFFNDYQGQRYVDDRKLDSLSTHIKYEFVTELNAAYDQLRHLESNVFNELYFTNTDGNTKLSYFSAYLDPAEGKWEIVPVSMKVAFSEIIWMDSEGNQRIILESDTTNMNSHPVNLGNRKYFSRVIGDSLWVMPGDSIWASQTDSLHQKRKFVLQSIRSWRTRNYEVGISIKPADTTEYFGFKPAAIAMVTRLYSITDPLLPPGFGFAIMDQDGNVLFHSDVNRNLQENFLEETDFDNQLVAALRGRLSVHRTVGYHDKDHRVLITPIDNVPLYLLTFQNQEYSKAPLTLTLELGFFFILMLFLIQGGQLLLLFATTYQSTKLRVKRFYLNWLRPRSDSYQVGYDKDKWPPSAKYQASILFQLILLGIFIGLMISIHTRWLVLCFLLLPVYASVFHFLLLRREKIILQLSDKLTSLLGRNISTPFVILLHPFFLLSVLVLFICNLCLLGYVENSDSPICLQLTIFILGVVCFWLTPKLPVKGWHLGPANKHVYIFSMLFWLILVSVLPVFNFYKTAHYIEYKTWTRYVELEALKLSYARERTLEAKKIRNSIGFSPAFANPSNWNDILTTGNYLFSTGEMQPKHLSKKYQPLKETPFDERLRKIGPESYGLVEESRKVARVKASDNMWHWEQFENELALILRTEDGRGERSIASVVPDFDLTKNKYALLFLVLAIIALIFTYRLLRYCVKHIYGLGLICQQNPTTSDSILKIVEKNDQNLFIVGLPYSHVDTVREDLLKLSSDYIDLRSANHEYTGNKLVILDHFEHGMNNHELNQQKLSILETMSRRKEVNVVILSYVHPYVILEYYDSCILDIANKIDNPELRREFMEFKHAARNWKNILVNFTIHTVSLKKVSKPLTDITNWLIDQETSHGTYLPRLCPQLESYKNASGSAYDKSDDIVLSVENMADNYYYTLWNNFSTHEKFLLYDLAKDRFVNLRNRKAIEDLLKKGVVEMKDTLQLMNRSFNNFILLAVKEDEEIKMESQQRSKGTWHSLQTVIFILIIASATFISFSQKGLMNNLNLWIGALTGISTLLVRFGGLFTTGKIKD
jgi:hypothetical protein